MLVSTLSIGLPFDPAILLAWWDSMFTTLNTAIWFVGPIFIFFISISVFHWIFRTFF